MFLTEHDGGILGIMGNVMHALAGGGGRSFDSRIDAFVLGCPCLAAIIGAEETGGRHADPHAVRVFCIGQNGVRAEAAEAWHQLLRRDGC